MMTGFKNALFTGVLLAVVVNGLPKKWVQNSASLKTITNANAHGEKDSAHTFGIVIMFTAAAGAVIGALKGMFGKMEQKEQEKATPAQEIDKTGKVQPMAQEPLRSPDVVREKVHAEGMEPAVSRVSAEESRPKEAVTMGR